MDFLSVLPARLCEVIATSRCGFSPSSMAHLFLRNDCNVERTLHAAQTAEENWARAQARFAQPKSQPKQKKPLAQKRKIMYNVAEVEKELLR